MPSKLSSARTRRQRANAIMDRMFKAPAADWDWQPKKSVRQALKQIPRKLRDWSIDYVGFFRASASEFLTDLKHHKLGAIVKTVIVLAIGWSLRYINDWLGLPLKDVALWVYHLLLPAWWAVITLAALILFLLAVINGSRKYHRRIIGELLAVDADIEAEQADNSAYIEALSLLYGQAVALWGYLDRQEILKTENPLPLMDIQYFEIELRNQLNRIEVGWGDRFVDGRGEISDKAINQKMRFYGHREELESRIKFYRQRREEIFDEGLTRKEKILGVKKVV